MARIGFETSLRTLIAGQIHKIAARQGRREYRCAVFQQPVNGRSVGMALGFDVRRESFKVTPTENLSTGDIVGLGVSQADAKRTHNAVFTEFNVPINNKLEIQAAGRVDKFPGFNAHVSPKIGARFEATKELLLQGTIETGFRAPNLTDSATLTNTAFSNGIFDPKRCDQAQLLAKDLTDQARALPNIGQNKATLLARADSVQSNECTAGVASIVRNNPDLKPEESRSVSVGFVFEPYKDFNFSIDYWNIKRKNEIGVKLTQDFLDAEDSLAPNIVNRASVGSDKTFLTAEEREKYGVDVGPLTSTSGQFENVAKTKVSGLDLSAKHSFNTEVGKVDLTTEATYMLELRSWSRTLEGGAGAYGDNLIGRYGNSRIVAKFGAALSRGNFAHSLL